MVMTGKEREMQSSEMFLRVRTHPWWRASLFVQNVSVPYKSKNLPRTSWSVVQICVKLSKMASSVHKKRRCRNSHLRTTSKPPYERLCTRTRFETEAKGNSEIAYYSFLPTMGMWFSSTQASYKANYSGIATHHKFVFKQTNKQTNKK